MSVAASEPLIVEWLDWLASGTTAKGTLRLRGYLIRAFDRDYPLSAATPADVQEYLGRAVRGPEARKSVLATLRSFYRFAVARGYLDADPTTLARSVRVPPGVPRPCPEPVLGRALARADDQTRLMLMLGAYAGLRLSEIAAVHSDHVTDHGLIVLGKGGRTRRIPVHPALALEMGFDGFAFPSPVQPTRHVSPDYVATRVEAALGGGWTAHSLRHRAGTQWYRASKDLRSVQALLGHASPTTTARYVMVDEDALAATVNAVA